MNRLTTYGVTLGVWVLIVAFLAVAPTYAQDGQPGLTNTICPVTVGEPVDTTKYVDYDGQRVYFCCDRCLKRFEANPTRYADGLARVMPVSDAAPGDADTGASSSPPGSASEAEQADHHGDGSSVAQGEVKATHHGEDSPASGQTPQHDITTGVLPRPGAGGAALLDEDHEHSAHEAQAESSFFTRLINWLGKFHPPTTHFPIGLLTAAAFAEFLFIKTKRPLFNNAAQFCVWLGAGGALAAVMLGWFFAGFRLVDDNWILTTHRWLGTSVALLSLIVAWLSFVSHREGSANRRPAYRAALFLTVSLVGATGFLGGAMIYGINHYVW